MMVAFHHGLVMDDKSQDQQVLVDDDYIMVYMLDPKRDDQQLW